MKRPESLCSVQSKKCQSNSISLKTLKNVSFANLFGLQLEFLSMEKINEKVLKSPGQGHECQVSTTKLRSETNRTKVSPKILLVKSSGNNFIFFYASLIFTTAKSKNISNISDICGAFQWLSYIPLVTVFLINFSTIFFIQYT